MRFNPDGKNNDNLLPEGEYDFEVLHADEKDSANGNAMMVVKLRAGENGTNKIITDYVLARNRRKIKTLAAACGLLDLFESGEIVAENLVGRKGRVKLAIEKSKSEDYSDRNVVVSYVPRR